MRSIIVIVHDIRSTHNVGSLLRTCDGFGVNSVIFSGYTPYPKTNNDQRLPHIYSKISKDIHKTALGAEFSVSWSCHDSISTLFEELRAQDYTITALEQSNQSILLPEFVPPAKIALLLGTEVSGIDKHLLSQCDNIVEIPMFGSKESFNVVQAAAVALYHCRTFPA